MKDTKYANIVPLIYIHNNFIDMAILSWCHLYNNRKDTFHFRKMAENLDDFKKNMLVELDLTPEYWELYRGKIKNYRNKNIAHIEPALATEVPDLDIAYKSVSFYYQYFIAELKENPSYSVCPDCMNKYANNRYKKYSRQISAIVESVSEE